MLFYKLLEYLSELHKSCPVNMQMKFGDFKYLVILTPDLGHLQTIDHSWYSQGPMWYS